MKRFEYKIEPGSSRGHDDTPFLNTNGKEGWELVSVSIEKGEGLGAKRRMYFFKRQIEE
ncbi:MAG: hypothetical protein WC505_01395 [Patescibacteria group bacterium]